MLTNCSACGGDLMDMRDKLVCMRCFTVNEISRSNELERRTERDTDRSPNYKDSDDDCF